MSHQPVDLRGSNQITRHREAIADASTMAGLSDTAAETRR